MKVKCIKTTDGTPRYADIILGEEYEVYDTIQGVVSKEYLIKDKSRKRKWYGKRFFKEVE